MPLVAELVTELKVQDGSFHQSMKLATVAIGTFVAAQAAMFYAINRSTKSIDEMGKAASKINVSVEAFQRLSYAAKITDTPLESVQNSFKFLAKNLDAANNGSTKMETTFKRLGLNTKELENMAPEKAWLMVADALNRVQNPAEQAALRLQALGKGGAEIKNLQASVRELEEEFDRLGITLSEQEVKQATMWNDSKKELEALFDGFVKKVSANVVPAFTEISDAITKTILKAGGLEKVADTLAEVIINDVDFMITGFQMFIDTIEKAVTAFHYFQNTVEAGENKVLEHQQKLQIFDQVKKEMPNGNSSEIWGEVNKRVSTLEKSGLTDFSTDHTSPDFAKPKQGDPLQLLKDMMAGAKTSIEGFKVLPSATDKATKSIKDMAVATDGVNSSLHGLKDILHSAAKAETDRLLKGAVKGKPQATNTLFEAVLDDIVKHPGNASKSLGERFSRAGGPDNSSATELETLKDIVAKSAERTDLSNEGMKGALDELNTYLKSTDKTTKEAPAAKVQLDISITPSKEFDVIYQAKGAADITNLLDTLQRQQDSRGF